MSSLSLLTVLTQLNRVSFLSFFEQYPGLPESYHRVVRYDFMNKREHRTQLFDECRTMVKGLVAKAKVSLFPPAPALSCLNN